MYQGRLPDFNEPGLARAVEALPPAAVDTLPFGVIRVDAEGIVRVYNATERRLSGSGGRRRTGLSFFADVAPCMDTAAFQARIERGFANGEVDVEFGWTGDFNDATRSFQIRVQSALIGGYWIFLKRSEA